MGPVCLEKAPVDSWDASQMHVTVTDREGAIIRRAGFRVPAGRERVARGIAGLIGDRPERTRAVRLDVVVGIDRFRIGPVRSWARRSGGAAREIEVRWTDGEPGRAGFILMDLCSSWTEAIQSIFGLIEDVI